MRVGVKMRRRRSRDGGEQVKVLDARKMLGEFVIWERVYMG